MYLTLVGAAQQQVQGTQLYRGWLCNHVHAQCRGGLGKKVTQHTGFYARFDVLHV